MLKGENNPTERLSQSDLNFLGQTGNAGQNKLATDSLVRGSAKEESVKQSEANKGSIIYNASKDTNPSFVTGGKPSSSSIDWVPPLNNHYKNMGQSINNSLVRGSAKEESVKQSEAVRAILSTPKGSQTQFGGDKVFTVGGTQFPTKNQNGGVETKQSKGKSYGYEWVNSKLGTKQLVRGSLFEATTKANEANKASAKFPSTTKPEFTPLTNLADINAQKTNQSAFREIITGKVSPNTNKTVTPGGDNSISGIFENARNNKISSLDVFDTQGNKLGTVSTSKESSGEVNSILSGFNGQLIFRSSPQSSLSGDFLATQKNIQDIANKGGLITFSEYNESTKQSGAYLGFASGKNAGYDFVKFTKGGTKPVSYSVLYPEVEKNLLSSISKNPAFFEKQPQSYWDTQYKSGNLQESDFYTIKDIFHNYDKIQTKESGKALESNAVNIFNTVNPYHSEIQRLNNTPQEKANYEKLATPDITFNIKDQSGKVIGTTSGSRANYDFLKSMGFGSKEKTVPTSYKDTKLEISEVKYRDVDSFIAGEFLNANPQRVNPLEQFSDYGAGLRSGLAKSTVGTIGQAVGVGEFWVGAVTNLYKNNTKSQSNYVEALKGVIPYHLGIGYHYLGTGQEGLLQGKVNLRINTPTSSLQEHYFNTNITSTENQVKTGVISNETARSQGYKAGESAFSFILAGLTIGDTLGGSLKGLARTPKSVIDNQLKNVRKANPNYVIERNTQEPYVTNNVRNFPTYRTTNPTRTKLPSNIFEYDTALTRPIGSARPIINLGGNKLENSTIQKNIAQNKKTQIDLLNIGAKIKKSSIESEVYYKPSLPYSNLSPTRKGVNIGGKPKVNKVDTNAVLGSGVVPSVIPSGEVSEGGFLAGVSPFSSSEIGFSSTNPTANIGYASTALGKSYNFGFASLETEKEVRYGKPRPSFRSPIKTETLPDTSLSFLSRQLFGKQYKGSPSKYSSIQPLFNPSKVSKTNKPEINLEARGDYQDFRNKQFAKKTASESKFGFSILSPKSEVNLPEKTIEYQDFRFRKFMESANTKGKFGFSILPKRSEVNLPESNIEYQGFRNKLYNKKVAEKGGTFGFTIRPKPQGKAVSEDIFYSPQQNIRQFFERIESNNGIGRNKARIDTNAVLGIDIGKDILIGESKSRLSDIERGGLARVNRENKYAKPTSTNQDVINSNVNDFFANQNKMFTETKINLGTGQGRLVSKSGGFSDLIKTGKKPPPPTSFYRTFTEPKGETKESSSKGGSLLQIVKEKPETKVRQSQIFKPLEQKKKNVTFNQPVVSVSNLEKPRTKADLITSAYLTNLKKTRQRNEAKASLLFAQVQEGKQAQGLIQQSQQRYSFKQENKQLVKSKSKQKQSQPQLFKQATSSKQALGQPQMFKQSQSSKQTSKQLSISKLTQSQPQLFKQDEFSISKLTYDTNTPKKKIPPFIALGGGKHKRKSSKNGGVTGLLNLNVNNIFASSLSMKAVNPPPRSRGTGSSNRGRRNNKVGYTGHKLLGVNVHTIHTNILN